ncbi:hypothetical protein HY357_03335 [Candidatus Roizmanbacteria bacterium]|nr:hypothetical protein [Candidatus Roizmanbacteria bacterium]
MKYKVAGLLEILLGIIVGSLSFTLLRTMQKASVIYKDFNADVKGNLVMSYLLIAIMFSIAIINLFFGIKLFSKLKEKYIKLGTISLIITLLGLAFIYAGTILSFVYPIYNLNSTLK